MNRRVAPIVALVLLISVVQTAAVSGPAPPRLIADNRTPYVVDLWVMDGNTWQFVTRVGPRNWQAFPHVASGSRWRAVFGEFVREHRVEYRFDPSYGGEQSIWWIQ
jgi:hypothetical protein